MKNLFFRKALYLPFLTIILLVSLINEAKATIDTNEVYKVVLKVGNFNFDHALDTLIGCASKNRQFYPAYILWGKDAADTTIADSLKFKSTKLIYPTWNSLRVRSGVDFVNPDTLNDIILVIWGRLQINSVTYKDTATSMVIFGKRGFDTLCSIDLNGLPVFQSTPFVAAKLRINYEFKEGKKRDLSEITSYVISDHSYSDTSGYENPINSINEPLKDNSNIKVYPNPSIYYIDVEVNEIPPGQYNIKIYDLSGNSLFEQIVRTKSMGDIAQRINTDNIPNGSYLLVVSSGNKMIGKYQLIILH